MAPNVTPHTFFVPHSVFELLWSLLRFSSQRGLWNSLSKAPFRPFVSRNVIGRHLKFSQCVFRIKTKRKLNIKGVLQKVNLLFCMMIRNLNITTDSIILMTLIHTTRTFRSFGTYFSSQWCDTLRESVSHDHRKQKTHIKIFLALWSRLTWRTVYYS